MTTPEPPPGDDGYQRWEDDTEQFPQPPIDDGSGGFGGYAAEAGGAYYPREPGDPLTEEELCGLRSGAGTGSAVYSPRRVLPLEDEPSSVVQRYLFPTEKFR